MIAELPKPKVMKETQPIHDVGVLHAALAQAQDFHQKIAKEHQQAVDTCNRVIAEAQVALKTAMDRQTEHQKEATSKIDKISGLIKKVQEQNPTKLPGSSKDSEAKAAPADQQQEDKALLNADLKVWLATAQCPPHLLTYLQTFESKMDDKPPTTAASASTAQQSEQEKENRDKASPAEKVPASLS